MTLSVTIYQQFSGITLDIAFEAPKGITALFGPSGAGKTSVINTVAGLLRPDRGRIVVGGTTLLDSSAGICVPPHKRGIGYVFQDGRLFPHMTVAQNLRYGQRFACGRPRIAEFGHIVEILGIEAILGRRPSQLSGGEKSRVSLGRAILSSPRILLMDEPMAALDEARKAGILPYLERLHHELHLPILYVSHSLQEVVQLAETIVLLANGRVSMAGPTAEVLSDPASAAMLGTRMTGAVITARVEAQEDDGLTRLATAGGPLFLPHVTALPGARLRLRILAQDVMLALTPPRQISALNILLTRVESLGDRHDGGMLVRLSLGGDSLLSHITDRSVETLGLSFGQEVYAVIKAVSLVAGGADSL